jgi:hypothetical protein
MTQILTTTPTIDGAVAILDPSKPAGLQPAASLIERVYERYMPEQSEIASRTFRDRIVKLKSQEAHVVSVWTPAASQQDQLAVPAQAVVSETGTAVPASDILPGIQLPVRTPLLDPRQDPFKGNIDLLSVYIAQTLAKHVSDEVDRLRAETGSQIKVWFGDISIIAELPETLPPAPINGLLLSATCPMLYGRLFIYLRKT